MALATAPAPRGEPLALLPAPEIVVCDELAFLIAAARDLAWASHCNVVGLRYVERREAHARLRGALLGYDRARGAL